MIFTVPYCDNKTKNSCPFLFFPLRFVVGELGGVRCHLGDAFGDDELRSVPFLVRVLGLVALVGVLVPVCGVILSKTLRMPIF